MEIKRMGAALRAKSDDGASLPFQPAKIDIPIGINTGGHNRATEAPMLP
jgi:hypothetical protein